MGKYVAIRDISSVAFRIMAKKRHALTSQGCVQLAKASQEQSGQRLRRGIIDRPLLQNVFTIVIIPPSGQVRSVVQKALSEIEAQLWSLFQSVLAIR